jgi:predicted nucleotide-binding protein
MAKCDFAVLVAGPDDWVYSKERERLAPRDNVIFELGLFMGALTRDRTYIVQPRDIDLKLPTDLLGITVLHYSLADPADVNDKLMPVCRAIENLIQAKGCR